MNALAALLAERIRRFGPITFAEYMRECLYHPLHGYYCRPESRRFADYYTSVDVHPIFGRLLARQFAEMWEQLGNPAEFLLVEAGAGIGLLASQILRFAEASLPDFYASLHYIAVERSPGRCDQMASRLARFIQADRCQTSLEIPSHMPVGCVFSNELLDALPFHRIIQNEGVLQEIFVGWENANFTESVAPLSTCAITDYFAAQHIALQEGQRAEAGLEACDWIREIGRRLERGFVLSIDYGHEAADLFDAHHMAGTVLAYANHQANEKFYEAPGEQDLTAHVNFTAIRLWGERAGLRAVGRTSQTAFLLALGQRNDFADLYDQTMGTVERVQARLQLKSLIYPEGMGERFHVLIQQKGIEARLTGLAAI